MFPVATFSLSLLALTGVFALKDWELRNHRKLFAGLRRRLTEFVETRILPAQVALPEMGKRHASILLQEAKVRFFNGTLRLLHAAEALLLKAFLFVRGKRTLLHSSEAVSPFLRDIAAHKKSLVEEREKSVE